MLAIQETLTSLPMVEELFLNPLGLLAVLAVIPLLIFYLMKPKPEEQVMPSMMFFQEEEKDDKLRKAYKKLVSNLPLLLQILAVLGFTIALANPYLEVPQTSDSSVVVLDRSASVKPEFQQLKKKVLEESGDETTLILADKEVKVKAEKASPSRLRSALNSIEAVETETDIVSALELAQDYGGKVIVASDLDQTRDERDVVSKLDSLAPKPIKVIQPDVFNRWGITSVEPEKNNTKIEISNFQAVQETLDVETNNGTKKVELGPDSSVQITVASNLGKNTVTLPEDGNPVDNKAHYVIPDREKLQISYIGPVNRHLDQSIKLIENMEINYEGEKIDEADIFMVSNDLRDSQKINEIKKETQSGKATVIFGASDGLSTIFDIGTSEKTLNQSVTIQDPLRVSLGEAKIYSKNLTLGKSLSKPENALKRIKYGEGEVLAYNFDSASFRKNILYPIFWKRVLNDLVDRPQIEELNLDTGRTISVDSITSPDRESLSGNVELNKTGFYSTESGNYAVNLESRKESNIDSISYPESNQKEFIKAKTGTRHLLILALLLIILADLTYLWYRGDL